MDEQFTTESIYSLGIQILHIFERIHATGYVYNNLNPDNLLLDYDVDMKTLHSEQADIFELRNVNMINMRFATPFLQEYSKQHVSMKVKEAYRGSLLFSSVN